MDIKITGKNIDVGDALRSQIGDRLSHDVSKYFDGIVDGHVTVFKEASTFRSECTLHLSTTQTKDSLFHSCPQIPA